MTKRIKIADVKKIYTMAFERGALSMRNELLKELENQGALEIRTNGAIYAHTDGDVMFLVEGVLYTGEGYQPDEELIAE